MKSLHLQSERRRALATFFMFLSIPLSGSFADVYLPSFPAMSRALQVPESQIQLTLAYYFLSYGIGQFLVGSVLDAIGRYKPNLVAVLCLAISAWLVPQTQNINIIYVLRIVQGLAVATMVVANRAFIVDLFEGDKRKHNLSLFTVTWSLGPIVAPFVGGFLQKYFGWEANFYFLAIYTMIIFALNLIFGGETLAERKLFHLDSILKTYREILTNKAFLVSALLLGVCYGVVIIFNIAGPFLVENHFKLDSVATGYCTLVLGFGWMIGGLIGKKLIEADHNKKMIYGSAIQLVCAGTLLLISLHVENLWVLVGLILLINTCSGLIFNVNFTHALLMFPRDAGVAGGIAGAMIYFLTSIFSFLVSNIGTIQNQWAMSERYIVGAILVALMVAIAVRLTKRQRRLQETKSISIIQN